MQTAFLIIRNAFFSRVVFTRLILCVAVVSLPVFAFVSVARAQGKSPASTEYDLKSVFVYTFGNYTTWPVDPNDDSEFVIGVFGDSDAIAPLNEIAKKRKIQKRTMRIKEFRSTENDFENVRILFVSARSLPEKRAELIAKLKDSPVLLVGESPGFLAGGGHCEFRVENDNVKFELSVSATKASGLSYNAKLLRLSSKHVKKTSSRTINAGSSSSSSSSEPGTVDSNSSTEK